MFLSRACLYSSLFFFFFNDTATTEIYTLSLHDALPISDLKFGGNGVLPKLFSFAQFATEDFFCKPLDNSSRKRSEEHTSELQSQSNLVCRLLLEKKKKKQK